MRKPTSRNQALARRRPRRRGRRQRHGSALAGAPAQSQQAPRAASERGRPLNVSGADGGYRHVRVHGPDDAPDARPRPRLDRDLRSSGTARSTALAGRVPDRRPTTTAATDSPRTPATATTRSRRSPPTLQLVLDADDVRRASRSLLAGHSMGAMTIAAWAEANRGSVAERVRGAAFISTGLEELTTEQRVVRPLPGPFAHRPGKARRRDPRDAGFDPLRAPADRPRRRRPTSALGSARARRRTSSSSAAHGARLPYQRARTAAVDRDVADGSCSRSSTHSTSPTIVVAGERPTDARSPMPSGSRQALPHSARPATSRPTSGHMTPLECPELVNEALSRPRRRRDGAASASAAPSSPPSASGARRPGLRVLAVPVDRPLEALLEADRRLPAQASREASPGRRTGGRSRPPGCPCRGCPARRRCPASRAISATTSPTGIRPPAAGVERLAADVVAVEAVGDRKVGGRGVLDVEEVALRRAVRAQDRRPAVERRADRLGDQAREVEVAAAVDVREAGDRDRAARTSASRSGRSGPRRPSTPRTAPSAGAGSPPGRAALRGLRRPCRRRRTRPARRRVRDRPEAASRCRGRWIRIPAPARPARC